MNEEEKSKRIWADFKSGKFEVYSPEGDHQDVIDLTLNAVKQEIERIIERNDKIKKNSTSSQTRLVALGINSDLNKLLTFLTEEMK